MNEFRMPITLIYSLLYSQLIIAHLLANFFNFSPMIYISLCISSLIILFIVLKAANNFIGIFTNRSDSKFYILIFIFWTALIYSIGPFDIVPSDFLQHLSAVRFALIELNHWDYFKFIGPWYSDKGNHYGYMPQALLAFLLGEKPSDLLFFWNWLNPLILLLSIFELSLNILRMGKTDPKISGWVSFLSAISFPFIFGVDSFSYIRAYSIAAALPGFILFIFILNIIFSLARFQYVSSDFLKKILLIVFFVFVQYLNHPQEALFSITIIISFILYSAGKSIYLQYFTYDFDIFLVKVIQVYLILVVGYLCAGNIFDGKGIFSWGFFSVWNFDPLMLLSRVYGVCGTVIFAVSVALLRGASWEKPVYLLIFNMCLFVFNPLFQVLVERFYEEAIIYRFVFVAPISIFLSFAVYKLILKLANRMPESRRSFVLLPLGIVFYAIVLTSDKRPSLVPLKSTERAALWGDLTLYLEVNIPEFKRVFSDPVTGYVLNAYTQQQFYGDKFYPRGRYVPLNIAEFSGSKLQSRRGSLLVVNLRNGDFGEFGRENGHWSDRILEVSGSYTSEFLSFLEMSPEVFRVAWRSSDGLITVYLIEG